MKHEVNTGGKGPIAQKPYKTDDKKKKVIKEEIDKMLKDGVIQESHSS